MLKFLQLEAAHHELNMEKRTAGGATLWGWRITTNIHHLPRFF
jgi:hypothetical protein